MSPDLAATTGSTRGMIRPSSRLSAWRRFGLCACLACVDSGSSLATRGTSVRGLLVGAALILSVVGQAEGQGWQQQEPVGTCKAGIMLPPVTSNQCRFIQHLEKDLWNKMSRNNWSYSYQTVQSCVDSATSSLGAPAVRSLGVTPAQMSIISLCDKLAIGIHYRGGQPPGNTLMAPYAR
jgi:hypothetical protein